MLYGGVQYLWILVMKLAYVTALAPRSLRRLLDSLKMLTTPYVRVHMYTYTHTCHEERSIFWEVTVPVIVRKKKKIHTTMCLTLNGY
jgi:hypothetical protein